MSEEKDIAQQIVSFPCDTIFYRALKPSWVKDDEDNSVFPIAFYAFMRRYYPETGEIEEGVSLCFNLEKGSKVYKTGKYVASLTFGQIQDISKAAGLDLSVDNSNPYHTEIRGLPCPKSKKTESQRVGGLLAKQCKLHLKSHLSK
jgi:hypothetical protein